MVRLAPQAAGAATAKAKVEAKPKAADKPKAEAKAETKEASGSGGVVIGQSPDGFDWGGTF